MIVLIDKPLIFATRSGSTLVNAGRIFASHSSRRGSTLINFEYAGKQGYTIGENANDDRVQPQMVDIAFGKRSFEGRAGLYFAAFNQEAVKMQDRIQYTSWIKDDSGRSFVAAGAFMFYGFRFFLCLEAAGFPDSVELTGREMRLLHRVQTINLEIENKPSQHIEFSW